GTRKPLAASPEFRCGTPGSVGRPRTLPDDPRQLLARVGAHALARAIEVALHTADRHVQALRDVLVGHARDRQLDDLTLPLGQWVARRTPKGRGADAAAFVGQPLSDRCGVQPAPALLTLREGHRR